MRKYRHRFHCYQCERHRDECGRISEWSGLCEACALSNMRQNVHGLATHSGPAFHRWRQAMARCVGAALMDEPVDDA
jgi:hypothetical protein